MISKRLPRRVVVVAVTAVLYGVLYSIVTPVLFKVAYTAFAPAFYVVTDVLMLSCYMGLLSLAVVLSIRGFTDKTVLHFIALTLIFFVGGSALYSDYLGVSSLEEVLSWHYYLPVTAVSTVIAMLYFVLLNAVTDHI